VEDKTKIGIIICDNRCRMSALCAGGKCLRALRDAEMKRNGAQVIHLSTGLVVGYPPCPYIEYFRDFIREKFGLEVVIGTHPIPQKYYITHVNLRSWDPPEEWEEILQPTLADEKTRLSYD